MPPGVTVCVSQNSDQKSLLQTLDSRTHPRTTASVVLNSEPFIIAESSYSTYPVNVDKDEKISVILEGKLYSDNWRALASDIRAAVRDTASAEVAASFRERLRTVDGDFLIVVVDHTNEKTYIANDFLGRLPFYYHSDGYRTIATRSELAIADTTSDISFDRIAMAQYLVFGYPLGTRTFFENANRLNPGELLVIDSGGTSTHSLWELDIGQKNHSDRSVSKNAAALVETFTDACAARTGLTNQDIVSLSGGLDSRSVLAGVNHVSPVTTASFDHKRVDDPDMSGALSLSRALNVDWHRFQLGEVTQDLIRQLLISKGGMNHLTSAYVLKFNEYLLDHFGDSITVYTGDGGDKVMPRLSPLTSFTSDEELIDYIISSNQNYTIREAADICGLSVQRLYESIGDRIATYPETDYGDLYTHFLIRERAMNRFFQGEDRSRCFFWTASPFYALPVFEYAMGIPDTQKKSNQLYDQFLSKLDNRLLTVKNVEFGARPGSRRHTVARRTYETLSNHKQVMGAVKPIARRVLNITNKSSNPNTFYTAAIHEYLNSGIDSLSADSLKEIVEEREKYSRTQIGDLSTIVSVILEVRSEIEC